ncbi:MAG: hypothetical protein M2R46_04196 [Verrucomicrobia subdivision 3 bacterium]|nr:hypothetical protein [Limisphaerales bacterium]
MDKHGHDFLNMMCNQDEGRRPGSVMFSKNLSALFSTDVTLRSHVGRYVLSVKATQGLLRRPSRYCENRAMS